MDFYNEALRHDGRGYDYLPVAWGHDTYHVNMQANQMNPPEPALFDLMSEHMPYDIPQFSPDDALSPNSHVWTTQEVSSGPMCSYRVCFRNYGRAANCSLTVWWRLPNMESPRPIRPRPHYRLPSRPATPHRLHVTPEAIGRRCRQALTLAEKKARSRSTLSRLQRSQGRR